MTMAASLRAVGAWARLRVQLRQQREVTESSQAAVADFVGVSRETIQRWEAGRQTPNAAELHQWCAAVGLRLDAVEAGAE